MPIKWKTAIITLSDKGYAGEREDKSGPLVREMIERAGYEVTEMVLLPDERMMIEEKLKELCDERETDLILTTGGTGFSPRDCTPEATLAVAERNAPGINLPGSPKAVKENLEYILPSLSHGLEIMKGITGECGSEAKNPGVKA